MPGKGTSLIPITVRFTKDAYDAISDTADSNYISKADLVRQCVEGNLAEYLGTIRILDREQAVRIRVAIRDLFNEVSKCQRRVEQNRRQLQPGDSFDEPGR